MSRHSQSRKYTRLFYVITTFTPIFLLALLSILLFVLQHLLLFQRKLQIRSSESKPQLTYSRPALVTMADPSFQHCALNLLKSARNLKWRHPIFMLSINFQDFDPAVVEDLQRLGVFIINTNAIFDRWLFKPIENKFVYRTLEINKFRKMELFLNPIFRSFERLIYIDADGVLSSRLDPLVDIQFPSDATLLMRQNDRSVRKGTLWKNEIVKSALTASQLSTFSRRFPDREKTGASCWFIVNVKMLQSPQVIFSNSIGILCNFRAAFKLNDQTLLNLLFYDNIFLFPWCAWDVVPIIGDSESLRKFCGGHMHLQRWINGDLTFIYRHMSVNEKKRCITSRLTVASSEQGGFFTSFLDNNKSCIDSLHEWKQMATGNQEFTQASPTG